jgi:hypothetical protein
MERHSLDCWTWLRTTQGILDWPRLAHMNGLDSHTIQGAARWTVAARVLQNTGYFESTSDDIALFVLVHLGFATLLLVLGTRTVGGDGALELRSLGNTLALLALLVLLGDFRAVVCIAVGEALLLAGGLVGALGLAAWVRL